MESLVDIRHSIDIIDHKITELLCERFELALNASKIKKIEDLPKYDGNRENDIKDYVIQQAINSGLDPEFSKNAMNEIYECILRNSRKYQQLRGE